MRKFNVLLMIFIASLLFAQPHSKKRNNEFGRRFEDLEKIKLLEILDLDEDKAIKFFSGDQRRILRPGKLAIRDEWVFMKY